jgi:tetratricopeptide (TPR) repeat protein
MARAILETAAWYPAEEPSDPTLLTPVAPSVGIRGFLALALSALGQFNDALAQGAEAMRRAEKLNRSPELAWANYCFGRTVLEQGNAEPAAEYLERAFALTRDWEPTTRVQLLEIQGGALLAAQRVDEAASVATAALETARSQGQPGHEAWMLRFLGEIARRRRPDTIEPALSYLDSALALADKLRMRPLLARCRLERAEVLYHAGRRDEAGQSLALAIDDLRAMEMKTWLDRAGALEEALRCLRVPVADRA